ncbi:glycosyltransferase family 25 protein [Halovulum marinum]|uniref:glycosyltransferase family 25 protein n=1 Tax=Halovulum marinum TaxID=2662447 RepID=UPI002D7965D8|nr:glycosyltransferase family 25 protein [Halovulum marinum]
MGQDIAIYVINLDRRPDRLAFMAGQLDALGLAWRQVAAVDAQTVADAELAPEVALAGHRVRMGRGSQCCAVTNFRIFRELARGDALAALILQDDVQLSPELVPFLRNDGWLPEGIGLIQLEKYGRKTSTRLAGPPLGESPVPGRQVRRLYSRTGGAGAFIVTRTAARTIIARKGVLDVPIDHFLFSPNAGWVFGAVGVAIVTPALAVQRQEAFASDIAAERSSDPKPLPARLRRLWMEVNRAPMQAAAWIGGARPVPFGFEDRTG